MIIQAGDSDGGRELAAERADVIFSRHSGYTDGRAFYTDVKQRLGPLRPAPGRPQDHPRRDRRSSPTPTPRPMSSPPTSGCSRSARRGRSRSSSRCGAATCRRTIPTDRCPTSIPTSTAASRSRVAGSDTKPTRSPSPRSGGRSPSANGLSIRQLVMEVTARSAFVGSADDGRRDDRPVRAGRRRRRLHPRPPPHAARHRPLRRRSRPAAAGARRVPRRLRGTDPARPPGDPPAAADAALLGSAHSAGFVDGADRSSLALIGAGPTASSLLERLAANAPDLLAGRSLQVHLIDPHRAGTGRVWRPDLHPLLWMNSMAEDVTMFTDDSVQCAGPIAPGPSLHEWAREVDDVTLAASLPAGAGRRDPRPRRDDVPDPTRPIGVPRLVPPRGVGLAARRCRGGRARAPWSSTSATVPTGARSSCSTESTTRCPPTSSCCRSVTSTPCPDADGAALAPFAAEHGPDRTCRPGTRPSRICRCSRPVTT